MIDDDKEQQDPLAPFYEELSRKVKELMERAEDLTELDIFNFRKDLHTFVETMSAAITPDKEEPAPVIKLFPRTMFRRREINPHDLIEIAANEIVQHPRCKNLHWLIEAQSCSGINTGFRPIMY